MLKYLRKNTILSVEPVIAFLLDKLKNLILL